MDEFRGLEREREGRGGKLVEVGGLQDQLVRGGGGGRIIGVAARVVKCVRRVAFRFLLLEEGEGWYFRHWW